MKSGWAGAGSGALGSLPVRGAWVEMLEQGQHGCDGRIRRSPCGERGLK